MSTALVSIYGKLFSNIVQKTSLTQSRANRAQYAEVSFRSPAELEAEVFTGIELPSVQGTSEEEGSLQFSLHDFIY